MRRRTFWYASQRPTSDTTLGNSVIARESDKPREAGAQPWGLIVQGAWERNAMIHVL